MIKYCKNCLFPETKPDLVFNSDGICNACTNYNDRPKIDWEIRSKELTKILSEFRGEGKWDCIIPVSGGKDSTYQVLTMIDYGMTPLCVNSRTCDLSELGRRNIENLRRLGVDLIEVVPNPKVRAKLNKIGLKQVGDISWPEHIGMFTLPFRIAVEFNIPLIVYGENSQHEYGGPESLVDRRFQDRRWLEEIGGMLGLRISDVIGLDGLTEKDLHVYQFPTEKDLKKVGVSAIYLGYFIPWEGHNNFVIASENGLETYGKPVEGSIVDYENLDNHQNGIHEYLKYIKHGYGRATDQASILIRRGMMTREEGLKLVKAVDGNFPNSYLGKSLERILEPLEMSVEEFSTICDRFTNKKLFLKDEEGNVIKDKEGNIKKINYDN